MFDGFDLSASFRVFPFGVVLFDFLFLLVAIPIEAYILNRRLKFDKRTSSFYAISMNVFSNVIGWVIFFLIEPTNFFDTYKAEFIGYLLYNHPLDSQIYGGIVLAAFVTFFGTLIVKFGLLKILIISLSDPGDKKSEPEAENAVPLQRRNRRNQKIGWQSTSLLATALIANCLSYTAITLVVVFRFFARTSSI